MRNLHAANCRGIVLSWGVDGPNVKAAGRKVSGRRLAGHGDANGRPVEYVRALLHSLGYRHNAALGASTLALDAKPRYSWFDRSLNVYERITPLDAGHAGCSPG